MLFYGGPNLGPKLELKSPRPELFGNQGLGPDPSPKLTGPIGPEARNFSARVASIEHNVTLYLCLETNDSWVWSLKVPVRFD